MGRLRGRLRARLAARLAVLLVLQACAHAPREGGPGVSHVVRPGENLYRISLHYEVAVDRIARANDVDAGELRVGQRLWIPGATRPQPAEPLAPPRAALPPSGRSEAREQARREADLSFAWPVRGRLSSRFGRRWGRPHEGIDISARPGTPVLAAESGRVIHSGRGLGDYGNVVIVKHAGPYSTIYAHNRRNLVPRGAFVEKGERIAEVGTTGNASGPHLHFELRRQRAPENPLAYLP